MSGYVWQHGLKGEADRLRLMSRLLDPSSRFHSAAHRRDGGLALPGDRRRQRLGVASGWRNRWGQPGMCWRPIFAST